MNTTLYIGILAAWFRGGPTENRVNATLQVTVVVWTLICVAAPIGAGTDTQPVRVAYLPFEDNVRLRDTWDLAVDIPRWFSRTVDTIGGATDGMVVCVPFDSSQALLEKNQWRRREYLEPLAVQRLAGMLNVDYVVTGMVERFKVMKRAVSGDGEFGGGHSLGDVGVGAARLPLSAVLQGYSADVRMTVEVLDARTGAQVHVLPLAIDEREGGLQIWLPTSVDNPEIDYYHMERSEFGSEYFHRNPVGAVMKACSQRVRAALRAQETAAGPRQAAPREFLEGRLLDRQGNDVYLNLGDEDHLLVGEVLEVLKPQRPVLDEQGDTLGWVEVPVGAVRIRSVKSAHFSQAYIVEEQEPFTVGWTVRAGKGHGDGVAEGK